MKLVIDHTFAGLTCSEYEELYFDEPFSVALAVTLGLDRELLRLERAAGRIVRQVRCEPMHHAPSAAGQALGKARASFVEEIDYDLGAHRGEWKTVPSVFPDRVRNRGTLAVIAVPDGVRRLVNAEVSVSAFGFGGGIEKMIAAEIVKSYATSADFTKDWISRYH